MTRVQVQKCTIVTGFVLSVVVLCLTQATSAQEPRAIADAFRELSDPSLKGAEYAAKRERFLQQNGVADFLRSHAPSENDIYARTLAVVLQQRCNRQDAFLAVESKYAKAIKVITQLPPPLTRHGNEARPDPMGRYHRLHCLSSQEIQRRRARTLQSVEKAIAAGRSPSGYLPPDETADSYRQKVLQELDATYWDSEMPFLGLSMLEVALKGWPDEKAVAELQQKGWGDFYRYMAVHLIGELRYKEAADYLALVFSDEKEDKYLRAHAARALSKIADSKYLTLLAEHLFLGDLPKEAQYEVKFEAFDAQEVVRTLAAIFPRVPDRERKGCLTMVLEDQARRAPSIASQVRDVLKTALAVEKDPQVRLSLKRCIEDLPRIQQPAPVLRRYERTDLAFDDCTPADDWDVMRNAAEGKADAATLQEVCKRYLAAVDSVARQYTNANVFATKELHSDGWPGNVDDAEARDFFKTVASLKPGMSRIEVLAKLPADVWIEPHDPDYTLGKEVVWHCVARRFSKEVEGPFGLKRKGCEFILIFLNDKLRVVHVSH